MGIDPNAVVLKLLQGLKHPNGYQIAIEMVECYGMEVGRPIFETVYWIGRFTQASRWPVTRIGRRAIKLHVCEDTRAAKKEIRQGLLSSYSGRFGIEESRDVIGRKKAPGPLYGVATHLWDALAVAETAWEHFYGRGGIQVYQGPEAPASPSEAPEG